MVTAIRALDRVITLSSQLAKAGTQRYVRVKGEGQDAEGNPLPGMDKVRLRNGAQPPPGFQVMHGKRGGEWFNIDANADLDELQPFARGGERGQPAPKVAAAPAGENRVANVQPAGEKPNTPIKQREKKPLTPDTYSDPNRRAVKLERLRGQRAQIRRDLDELNGDVMDLRAQNRQLLQGLERGEVDQVPKLHEGIDHLASMEKQRKGWQQRFDDINQAVQDEKGRQREADQRREERHERHANADLPFSSQLHINIGPPLGPDAVTSTKRLGHEGANGVNADATYKAQMKDGVFEDHYGLNPKLAVYKAVAEEAAPELAAYGMAQALGWDIVPEVRAADLGKGAGHVMRWADNAGQEGATADLAWNMRGPLGYPELEDQYIQMWVLDALIGNTDRHEQNWMIDRDAKKIWAIDSGRSGSSSYAREKLPGPNYLKETLLYGRTYDWDYGGRGRRPNNRINYGARHRAYAQELINHVKQNEGQVRAAVAKLDPQAVKGFNRRLQDLYGQVL